MIKMQEILDFTVSERIVIVEKIWDSIEPQDIRLTTSHENELDSRLARYERGETKFFNWLDIKKELNTDK